MILQAIGVFAALAALDFVWAKYTYAMTEKMPALAGGYASGIILLSGAAAIGYTQAPWLLIPAMAGAFVGTFLAVKYKEVECRTLRKNVADLFTMASALFQKILRTQEN